MNLFNRLLDIRRKILLKFHRYKNNKIVLGMFVKNEANNSLKLCLERIVNFIDYAIIIDDKSTDNTPEICENALNKVPHRIITNCKYTLKTESKLRQYMWKQLRKTKCGWVLIMDADEIFPENCYDLIKSYTNSKVDAIDFILFDMWDKNHFRSDDIWNVHTKWYQYLIRIQPFMCHNYKNAEIHPGRFPKRNSYFKHEHVVLPIMHMGWSTEEIRQKKYIRYQENDSNPSPKHRLQYESILDKNPNLIDFKKYCKENLDFTIL